MPVLRWVALVSSILSIVFLVAGLVLGVLDGASASNLSYLIFVLACVVVGSMINVSRPRNMIGWLFLVCGFSFSLMQAAGEYALYGLVMHPGWVPVPRAGVWLDSWLPYPGIMSLVVFLPQFFPDGAVVSRGWARLVRFYAIFAGLLVVLAALRPEKIQEIGHGPALANPLGIPALADVSAIGLLSSTVILASGMVLGAASLIIRFRRAPPPEQVQIKWFAYAIAIIPVVWLVDGVVGLSGVAVTLALAALPVAVAVAVFRYHLYDIDILINRTLVYGSLSGVLAGIYVLGVIALQAIFRLISDQDSDLAVAISTLSIAVLFQPLRKRFQQVIDRRFYRHRYDAARALQSFSAVLRDEVDLDRLTHDILRVVDDTVQPAHAAVWLVNG